MPITTYPEIVTAAIEMAKLPFVKEIIYNDQYDELYVAFKRLPRTSDELAAILSYDEFFAAGIAFTTDHGQDRYAGQRLLKIWWGGDC